MPFCRICLQPAFYIFNVGAVPYYYCANGDCSAFHQNRLFGSDGMWLPAPAVNFKAP